MAWLILIASGAFEAVWAAAMSLSNGFRRPLPTIVFIVALLISMGGLAYSMTEIPAGTAYAVWTGIGALLAVIYSVASGEERLTPIRLGLLMLLIGCIVGLKMVV